MSINMSGSVKLVLNPSCVVSTSICSDILVWTFIVPCLLRVFVCSSGMGILVATDTRHLAHQTSTNLQRKGCVSQTFTPPVQYAALPGESELEVLPVQCIYVCICMTVCMYVRIPSNLL